MKTKLESSGVLYNLYGLDYNNSAGNLMKWTGILATGDKLYIKAPSSRFGHLNYECEAECTAGELASLLGMCNVVQYKLDKLHMDNKVYKVCVSRDFVGTGVYTSFNSLIPNAAAYSGLDKYNLVISNLPSLRLQLDNILLFDSIILNSDRHLRNLGVLNGNIIPLFDNGNSLFYDKTVDYIAIALRTELDYQPCKPFYNTFEEQLSLIAGNSLRPADKIQVYRIVNRYFKGRRAKLLNKLLIMRLERFGLLWK